VLFFNIMALIDMLDSRSLDSLARTIQPPSRITKILQIKRDSLLVLGPVLCPRAYSYRNENYMHILLANAVRGLSIHRVGVVYIVDSEQSESGSRKTPERPQLCRPEISD
jgi:hypothetical protein